MMGLSEKQKRDRTHGRQGARTESGSVMSGEHYLSLFPILGGSELILRVRLVNNELRLVSNFARLVEGEID